MAFVLQDENTVGRSRSKTANDGDKSRSPTQVKVRGIELTSKALTSYGGEGLFYLLTYWVGFESTVWQTLFIGATIVADVLI
jgi:hypothetical protein